MARTAKPKKSKKDLKISRYSDKRSRPGLYYGTDGLKPVYDKNGKIIRWVEEYVHPTKT